MPFKSNLLSTFRKKPNLLWPLMALMIIGTPVLLTLQIVYGYGGQFIIFTIIFLGEFQVSSWLNCELFWQFMNTCYIFVAFLFSDWILLCSGIHFTQTTSKGKKAKTTGYGGLNIRFAFLNKHIIEHIIQ